MKKPTAISKTFPLMVKGLEAKESLFSSNN
jgi:hypothetical protein